MNVSFDAADVLNSTVLESSSGSSIYQLETPKYSEGVLTTTASRRDYIDSSLLPVFQILWAGDSLENRILVVDPATRAESKARDILPSAQGGTTYGSITLNNIQYKWKAKGTGTKLVLVNSDTKAIVVESHRRIACGGGLFKTKTPRCMNLDIADEVVEYLDLILLTFLLVWRERVDVIPRQMRNSPGAAGYLPVEVMSLS